MRGKPLIVYHLERLARSGVRDVVINVAWLGGRIRAALGDGAAFGVSIRYSEEGAQALETGGGIFQALPWLGSAAVPGRERRCVHRLRLRGLVDRARGWAHLLLVPNPVQHPQGDFALEDGRVVETGSSRWTYSGIGLYPGAAVRRLPARPFPAAAAA